MVGRPKFKKFTIKNWQLALALLLLLFLAATLLRIDHIRMTELRDAVLAADAAGDDEKIAEALKNLQDFTFSHIVINIVEENGSSKVTFGTGPFYLEQQYLRHANAALEEAEKNFVDNGNPNGNIYAKAMEVCRPQAIAGGWAWNSTEHINCMLGQLALYPTEEKLQTTATATLPNTELYRHDYSSPLWTPSLTGFVILLCAILIIIIVIRIIIWCVLSLSLLIINKF